MALVRLHAQACERSVVFRLFSSACGIDFFLVYLSSFASHPVNENRLTSAPTYSDAGYVCWLTYPWHLLCSGSITNATLNTSLKQSHNSHPSAITTDRNLSRPNSPFLKPITTPQTSIKRVLLPFLIPTELNLPKSGDKGTFSTRSGPKQGPSLDLNAQLDSQLPAINNE